MNFELQQPREVAEKYTYHDAGTHGVYPKLVWEWRSRSPMARLDDAVEFLGEWKALRFKGGKIAFRRICTRWLRKNLVDLQRLQGRVLYKLAPEDFRHFLEIRRSFRDYGAPPTTFGKALHFFLPETLIVWDQAIVRNKYKLHPDPESFVSYQPFGWKSTTPRHTQTKPSTRYNNPKGNHARNSRILRTHHHDPRPPRTLTQTVRKNRRIIGRIQEGVLPESLTRSVHSRGLNRLHDLWYALATSFLPSTYRGPGRNTSTVSRRQPDEGGFQSKG